MNDSTQLQALARSIIATCKLQSRPIIAHSGWCRGPEGSSTTGKGWEQSHGMSAASEGSLLRQQRSAGEDSIDDEFTLEELR